MKTIMAILLLLAPIACLSQQAPAPPQRLRIGSSTQGVIPPDRMVPWSPGIPGGIPSYLVGVNVKNAPYNAKGDGVADDTAAFNAAISACPTGKTVYIPPGTYKLTSKISITKSIALRGAGPTQTFLVSTANNAGSPDAAILVSGSGSSVNNLSQKASRGSTSLVASTAGLAVGNWVSIKQTNDPSIVLGTLEHPTLTLQSQIAQIEAINGSNVTLSRPLYWDYNLAFSPFLAKRTMVTSAGIEDLNLHCTGTTTRGIFFFVAARCWAKNVIVTHDPSGSSGCAAMAFEIASQCNAQHCALYRPTNHTLEPTHYGFQIANLSSDNLIEDNIIDGFSAGVLIQGGSSGNVVAYNYVHRGFGATATTNDLRFGIITHGDFANSNLFEGNNVPFVALDNYWGCNRANTFLRNWIRRQSLNEINAEMTGTLIGARVEALNYYNNFVGNILCSPRDYNDSNGSHLVWELGYNRDNTYPSSPLPANPVVASTTLRHGNFDFVLNQTGWDPAISNHAIPNSYYLASKPSWFGAMAWPPIGPDVNTTSTITNAPVIPAQARSMGVNY